MSGETALKTGHHGNARVCPIGSAEGEDERQNHTADTGTQAAAGLYPWPAEAFRLDRGRHQQDDTQEHSKEWMWPADFSHDAFFSLEDCVQLERRWMLWHEFMKEHSCLDDWLRLAEALAASPNSSHVLYVTAKEELQKFENLRTEARMRLVQLDTLGQKSRVLVGLFRGAMRTRLVDMTKECGQRWDQLSITVDSVCRRLKHFVNQREDFERQTEEVSVWLADMDLRLTEVEHFSERDTCAKMRQLQGFQQAVAESAGRLNTLLQQGEELIQRSEPADAQAIESQLQDLLLYCARVFQGLGRLHTRLLSMRLVFEDDWALCPDSGCPSETVLEEEMTEDSRISVPTQNNPTQVTHEHLVLEWDPSVDIGGSISRDDADSSYFSVGAGVSSTEEQLGKDPLRRRSNLRPAVSRSAFAEVCEQQTVTERSLEGVTPPRTPVPDAGRPQHGGFWKTSTPDSRSHEPVTFDPDRISAWLGQAHRLCSKAVQTEQTPQQFTRFSLSPSMYKDEEEGGAEYLENVLPKRLHCQPDTQNMSSVQSCDLQVHTHKRHQNPQCLKKILHSSDSVKDGRHAETPCAPSAQVAPAGPRGPWPLRLLELVRAPALLCILLTLLLLMVIWPTIMLQDNRCHRSNALERSFHLVLRYVNGPPPT